MGFAQMKPLSNKLTKNSMSPTSNSNLFCQILTKRINLCCRNGKAVNVFKNGKAVNVFENGKAVNVFKMGRRKSFIKVN